jgi:hypothetical protein
MAGAQSISLVRQGSHVQIDLGRAGSGLRPNHEPHSAGNTFIPVLGITSRLAQKYFWTPVQTTGLGRSLRKLYYIDPSKIEVVNVPI